MDTDPAKLEDAPEQLEAEQARRQQTKIDAGEAVKGQTVIVVGCDEDAAEALANLPTTAPDGRAIYYDPNDIRVVVTGVPRADPDFGEPSPQIQTASAEGPSHPSEEPARSGPPSCSEPTYVRVTVRNGNDNGDPGAIAEAWFTIEDGLVVLRDGDDKHITSRALLKGEDPAVLARSLLREAEAPKDFNRPIHYPKLGLA
jgi:hypothetical protein